MIKIIQIKETPELKLNIKLLSGINLFSIFSVNVYYFAFGIRLLHIPQIGFPLLFFPLTLYICNQVLAADLSDNTEAVQKFSLVNFKPICWVSLPIYGYNHLQWWVAFSKKKHLSLLCYVTTVTVHGQVVWPFTCTHVRSLYIYPHKQETQIVLYVTHLSCFKNVTLHYKWLKQ